MLPPSAPTMRLQTHRTLLQFVTRAPWYQYQLAASLPSTCRALSTIHNTVPTTAAMTPSSHGMYQMVVRCPWPIRCHICTIATMAAGSAKLEVWRWQCHQRQPRSSQSVFKSGEVKPSQIKSRQVKSTQARQGSPVKASLVKSSQVQLVPPRF